MHASCNLGISACSCFVLAPLFCPLSLYPFPSACQNILFLRKVAFRANKGVQCSGGSDIMSFGCQIGNKSSFMSTQENGQRLTISPLLLEEMTKANSGHTTVRFSQNFEIQFVYSQWNSCTQTVQYLVFSLYINVSLLPSVCPVGFF